MGKFDILRGCYVCSMFGIGVMLGMVWYKNYTHKTLWLVALHATVSTEVAGCRSAAWDDMRYVCTSRGNAYLGTSRVARLSVR